MSTSAVILIIVAVIVILAVGWLLYTRRRKQALRARFGPEYSRAVSQYGNESRAQAALEARERRMEKIHVRSLSREDHQRFADQWQAVQRDFVDNPAGSIQRADTLVGEVMRARGYPMADFEHRAEDISVDHPTVVQKYRLAHEISERQASGHAGTEDLRQAVIYYRDLFDDLLETHTAGERIKR
jgi:hypothetical protein